MGKSPESGQLVQIHLLAVYKFRPYIYGSFTGENDDKPRQFGVIKDRNEPHVQVKSDHTQHVGWRVLFVAGLLAMDMDACSFAVE